ncbi:hypothetical protein [Bacillus thuringiensis]|uniref:hypothetical protein n=1 Tax=Bacillus thuringiensis TaxID=1428 RepID=UPI0021D66E02|nr:hypothetical protein [Bacillus thuringiensis]MCU7663747.1 hypothetical protein [Bacillus thuringiensis]
MTVKYKDVVFKALGGPVQLVWCEYSARFQNIVEVRYHVTAYEATEEITDELEFRKGDKLFESSWKKTPQQARHDVEGFVGELKKDNILWEKGFDVSIPIIDEDF